MDDFATEFEYVGQQPRHEVTKADTLFERKYLQRSDQHLQDGRLKHPAPFFWDFQLADSIQLGTIVCPV